MANKYNLANDRIYFIIGASMAAGRSFWMENGETGKGLKDKTVSLKISNDGKVGTFKFRGDNSAI